MKRLLISLLVAMALLLVTAGTAVASHGDLPLPGSPWCQAEDLSGAADFGPYYCP
ncbi:MAG: hypothetical protein ACE5IE_05515 [Dehalococcoidia bacterium]